MQVAAHAWFCFDKCLWLVAYVYMLKAKLFHWNFNYYLLLNTKAIVKKKKKNKVLQKPLVAHSIVHREKDRGT